MKTQPIHPEPRRYNRPEDRIPAPPEPPLTREEIRRELGFPLLPINDDDRE
jgi:hypothetical protein